MKKLLMIVLLMATGMVGNDVFAQSKKKSKTTKTEKTLSKAAEDTEKGLLKAADAVEKETLKAADVIEKEAIKAADEVEKAFDGDKKKKSKKSKAKPRKN